MDSHSSNLCYSRVNYIMYYKIESKIKCIFQEEKHELSNKLNYHTTNYILLNTPPKSLLLPILNSMEIMDNFKNSPKESHDSDSAKISISKV